MRGLRLRQKLSALRLLVVCIALFPLVGCDEATLAAFREKLEKASLSEPSSTSQFSSQDVIEVSPVSAAVSSERRSISASCSRLLPGSPRGLSCLHCTQPEAQGQAELILELLVQSCLKNISTNFLVDGTFQFDETFLMKQLDRLTQNDRRLFVSFYILNGSTQRRWNTTPIDAVGTKISPEEFRSALFNDFDLQHQIQQNVRRLLPALRFAVERKAVVSIVIALEDNLTNVSFSQLNELVLDALPPELPVAIGRNACPGCYSGNEDGILPGLIEEVHTASSHVARITRDGIVTNDGIHYNFAGTEGESSMSLDHLASVRDAAQESNNVFILWTGAFQGLAEGGVGTGTHPRDRNYVFPSSREMMQLVNFLRDGRV